MNALLAFCRFIDGVSERIGRFVRWLLLAAVLLSAVYASFRKAFSMGSNAYLEAQWYLFAAVVMLGAGYVLLHDQHVRIDVLSNKLGRRAQAWIDVIGIVVFLIPLCAAIVYMSTPTVIGAIASQEVSPNAGGLLRWPLYALLPIGFALLALQAFSELVKRIAFLTGKGPDPRAKAERNEEERLIEDLRRASQPSTPGAQR